LKSDRGKVAEDRCRNLPGMDTGNILGFVGTNRKISGFFSGPHKEKILVRSLLGPCEVLVKAIADLGKTRCGPTAYFKL